MSLCKTVKMELYWFGIRELLYHVWSRVFYSQKYHMRMLVERDKCCRSMDIANIKDLVAEQYRLRTGSVIDIDHPRNFNEKLQWIKIYDVTPEKMRLADKYLVREWVEEQIGKEYLIPLAGAWDSVDEINFDVLPERFCLKANHGSGMNYVVDSKSGLTEKDKKKIRRIAEYWMQMPYYASSWEFQYRDIPRKIIAEQYIEEKGGNLHDYKIHCFNGKPEIIQVIGDRCLEEHIAKEAFYDTDWNRNRLMYNKYEQYNESLPKPDNLKEMIEIAKKLSRNFIYVRVDLYDIDGKIKFGEMTFTPASGYGLWGENIPVVWWKN